MIITSSRMKTFHACQRLHEFQYNLGIRPIVDSEALEFGTLMHAGLEEWFAAWKADDGYTALGRAVQALRFHARAVAGLDDATLARAEILMTGYSARWTADMDGLEVLAVEEQFRAPIHGLRGVRLAGKVDAIVRKRSDGTKWLVEHKTTSADLSPGSTYWTRLRLDSQVSIYHDGARALGHVVDGCIYDVIRKPALRPLQANSRRAHDETPEEFQARIAEALEAEPDAYYQRAEVIRLDTEMANARLDVMQTARAIRHARGVGSAPRNTDHCFAYGGKACPFADVCAGAASIDDPTKFKQLATPHPELTPEREGTP